MTEHDMRCQLRRRFSDLADSIESVVRKVPGASRLVGAEVPSINIYETADALIVRAEVPGVSRDNLELRLTAGRLCIRCRPDPGQYETYNCLLRERALAEYSREIALPVAVDQDDDSTAVLQDGVLTVRLKKVPQHRGKSINVEVS